MKIVNEISVPHSELLLEFPLELEKCPAAINERRLAMETPKDPPTKTLLVTMPSKLGFHLRLASRFVQCVRDFRSSIRVRKGRMLADGKSILELLILGAAWKSRLEIVAIGEDASQVIEVIEEFFLNQDNLTISGT